MLRTARATLPSDIRRAASLSAKSIFANSDIFLKAHHIACYFAQGSEFDLDPIIKLIWEKEKNCYLPALTPTDEKELHFLLFNKDDSLQLNQHGILEPLFTAEKEIPPQQLDIVLVPLIGFDKAGHRLGSGSGYYDRTFSFLLKNTSSSSLLYIGVGFEVQACDNIDFDEWDIKLNGVLTEKELKWLS